MIIKQPGAEFFYEDVCYKIGDRIVGTDASEYQGLLGSIIEIRDGEDIISHKGGVSNALYERIYSASYQYRILSGTR